jgi:hypothetical protein
LDEKISKILSEKFIVIMLILAFLDLSLFWRLNKKDIPCYNLNYDFNYQHVAFFDKIVPEADLKYLTNFQKDSFPILHGDFGENSENQSLAY